jgi:hypothetical protein
VQCSLALDVFQLKDNAALFEKAYFKAISEHEITRNAGIRWGGMFKNISDFDHFEIYERK